MHTSTPLTQPDLDLAEQAAREFARRSQTDWRAWLGPICIRMLEKGTRKWGDLLNAALQAYREDRGRGATVVLPDENDEHDSQREALCEPGDDLEALLIARDTFDYLTQDCEERQRAAVALLVQGYTYREIAKQLGIHYSTVSRWITKARPRILARYESFESDLER